MHLVMLQNRRSALFLDRDGVLNALVVKKDGTMRPPWDPAELQISLAAVEAFSDSCFERWTKVVVTNQPDIARGDLTSVNLDRINEIIAREIPSIDSIYVCPHDNNDNCLCRKPKPGLLTSAAHELDIELASSFMVGDRWVDIAAGKNAGTRTILVESEHSWRASSWGSPPDELEPDFTIQSVRELSSIIHRHS